MLNKDGQITLLKALKYSDADIAEMTGDGDVALKSQPTAHVFNDADLATLKDNVKRGATEAAVEVYAKKMKADLGVTIDSKDPMEIAKEHAKAEAAKVQGDPDGKLLELQKSFDKLQKETIPALEKERDTFKGTLAERETFDKYKSYLHPDRNPALDDIEWVERLKRNYEIVAEGGKEVLKDRATGEVVKDNKENPRLAKDVIEEKFKSTPEWMKVATPAEPVKKPTFGVKTPGAGKKFPDNTAILNEVEKQLGTTKGAAAAKLYNQLVVESKQ